MALWFLTPYFFHVNVMCVVRVCQSVSGMTFQEKTIVWIINTEPEYIPTKSTNKRSFKKQFPSHFKESMERKKIDFLFERMHEAWNEKWVKLLGHWVEQRVNEPSERKSWNLPLEFIIFPSQENDFLSEMKTFNIHGEEFSYWNFCFFFYR